MSKYGNIKTRTSDGILHDSIREANRWCELNLLLKAGKIQDLQRQVKFVLIPAQYEEIIPQVYHVGKKPKSKLIERECAYIADFVYTENGVKVVEDVKGMRTKEYKLKKKMMLYFHGIRIREI